MNANSLPVQLGILVIFIAAMYFLLIRPQKKKEKKINEMRSNIQVGDEIITIGGICGKIVKTKDDTIVIQVGADKVKFEMTRWAVSSVTNPSKAAKVVEEEPEEEAPKKAMPKRLKKTSEDEEEQIPEDEK